MLDIEEDEGIYRGGGGSLKEIKVEGRMSE